MNKFSALIKINFKMMFDLSNKKNKVKSVAFILLMIMAFFPLVGMIFSGVNKLYEALSQINQQGMILGLGISLSALIIFVFGIFYCIGTFYFSMDIENLLYLPLKPSYILGSKFFMVVTYEYMTQLIFFFPILLQYGIKSNLGIIYYFYSIVIFLINPIIPLILASIIVMIIMRFTNVGKNKDKLKIIGWMFSLALAIGINLISQNLATGGYNANELQQLIMQGNNSYATVVANNIFPFAKIATLALLKSNELLGVVYLIMFIAINILFLIIFFYLAEKLYFKGVIGISESNSKRKALSDEELIKSVRRKSHLITYITKEMRILFRTPIYLMNCVIMNFLWPVFFIIPILAKGDMRNSLEVVRGFLNNPNYFKFIIPIFFGGIMFISSSNGIASTAISREGKNVFFNKYIPISYMKIFMAKVMSAILIELTSIISIFVILYLLFKIPIYMIITFLALSIEAILFTSFLGLLIDLSSPKLNWDNEQRAVKQNFNVVIHMILGIVFGVATAMAIIMLEMKSMHGFLFIIILYSALNFGLYYILKNKGTNMLNKIQI